jgi:hypothetical protein
MKYYLKASFCFICLTVSEQEGNSYQRTNEMRCKMSREQVYYREKVGREH